jgi:ribosomal protein S18 acetylase RimI-like enzyme
MSTIERSTIDQITIRRTLKDDDGPAIGELHRRVYTTEHGLNDRFTESVDDDVAGAIATGWPERRGAVWLVDCGGPLLGALALTDEGDGRGRVRWFALDRSLRGQGLGRSLFRELLVQARAQNLTKLCLETIKPLTVAARIYTSSGFRVVWERERTDWGPPVVYQGYELTL